MLELANSAAVLKQSTLSSAYRRQILLQQSLATYPTAPQTRPDGHRQQQIGQTVPGLLEVTDELLVFALP
jgi:hypothetical protein